MFSIELEDIYPYHPSEMADPKPIVSIHKPNVPKQKRGLWIETKAYWNPEIINLEPNKGSVS